jgi:hypothetical protein
MSTLRNLKLLPYAFSSSPNGAWRTFFPGLLCPLPKKKDQKIQVMKEKEHPTIWIGMEDDPLRYTHKRKHIWWLLKIETAIVCYLYS